MDTIQHDELELYTISKENTNGTALILGNAYGIMPYQIPLAKALSEKSITPWWFAFSGQNGTNGNYSGKSGLINIATALEYIAPFSKDKPLWIIAHCAGGLMALEYLRQNQYSPVEKLIVYGLLFNPNRRRGFALQKFKECGVKAVVLENEWNYNPLEAISKIQIPILFCHAKDKLNLFRARENEMKQVVETAQHAELVWVGKGYDNDIGNISSYIDYYYSFLTARVSDMAIVGIK